MRDSTWVCRFPSPDSSEFETTDVGIGGRLAWHPAAWMGVESEVSFYPAEFPDGVPFSKGRIEGLFGVTVGPSMDRVRPFARLRAGFLDVQEAPAPFACIAIFPPPLACTLSGRTLPVFDLGGGVEVSATRRVFARIDAGDRMLKYPGPVFDAHREVRNEAFISHDLRVAFGAGLRF